MSYSFKYRFKHLIEKPAVSVFVTLDHLWRFRRGYPGYVPRLSVIPVPVNGDRTNFRLVFEATGRFNYYLFSWALGMRNFCSTCSLYRIANSLVEDIHDDQQFIVTNPSRLTNIGKEKRNMHRKSVFRWSEYCWISRLDMKLYNPISRVACRVRTAAVHV